MNSNTENLLCLIEDMKERLSSNDYKLLLEALAQSNNRTNYYLTVGYHSIEQLPYMHDCGEEDCECIDSGEYYVLKCVRKETSQILSLNESENKLLKELIASEFGVIIKDPNKFDRLAKLMARNIRINSTIYELYNSKPELKKFIVPSISVGYLCENAFLDFIITII